MKREAELNILFNDIVNGYTKIKFNHSFFYIKHLDVNLLSTLDKIYIDIYNEVIKDGVPTEEQRLSQLQQDNFWGDKEESAIKTARLFLQGLRQSKSKQMLVSQKRVIQNKIDEQESKINILNHQKRELIGVTAEYLSNKHKNRMSVLYTVYNDSNLTNLYFNDFENYDENLLDEISSSVYSSMEHFTEFNIKCIALSNLFLSSFALSSDSCMGFYGKPATKLTLYQTRLFHHGKHMLKIVQDESFMSIPLEVRENPDKLVDWFEAKNIAKDKITNKNKQSGGGLGIIGATDEDMQAVGIQKEKGPNFAAEAAKKGGSLSIWDIQKLQGED